MDIKEISKRMTRSEFMNWYEDNEISECPSVFNINDSKKDDEYCKEYQGDCLSCIGNSVKCIKFKGDI